MRNAVVAVSILALQASGAAAEQQIGAHGLALPGSFAGVLPCADCPGIRHHLDLWPGGGFALRLEYLDRDHVVDRLGRWHVDPWRRVLVLEGAEPMAWQILGTDRLRLMDAEGQPIDSELPYELQGGPLAPTEVALPMTGMFLYMADAALFTECLTGQRHPVVMAGDYLALERAYLAERAGPGVPLLARIDGRIAEAEQMEGPPRPSVTVERLHHVTPDGACATGRAPAPLLDTFWRVTEVDDTDLPAGWREPYLLLGTAEGARFSATVGCNMMLGGFEQEAATLRFGAVASTMMACPPEIAALETAFAAALEATEGFDSDGYRLRLRDAEGRVRVRLDAVHTPH